MVNVKKPIRAQSKEVGSYLDRMETEMVEALRHGNIYKVFAKSKFRISDFQDFFSNQWKAYKGNIIQDESIKSMYASYHGPDVNQFPVHSKGKSMSQEGRQMFSEGMINDKVIAFLAQGGKFKAAKVKQSAEGEAAEPADEADEAAADAEQAMSYEELQDVARGTLSDWDAFLSDSWMQIMDAQMMSDYRTRMAEIKKEVDQLIMLAKQGKIGAEFVLIALAKVNSTKNGVLISGLGRKAFHANEAMNRVAEDLNAMDPSDPSYFGEMQMAQSKTRDGSFQLNLIVQDMQKAMQDVAGVMDQVHGMMSEINRVRREIITKFAARG